MCESSYASIADIPFSHTKIVCNYFSILVFSLNFFLLFAVKVKILNSFAA